MPTSVNPLGGRLTAAAMPSITWIFQKLRRRKMRLRIGIMTVAIGLAFTAGTVSAETLKFNVLGQPLATGLIQKNKEQPFFEDFAARTGLDAVADYKPLDMTGIKDTEELRVLKSGLFDIISLRMSQVWASTWLASIQPMTKAARR
jgi:hypothetical protein